MLCIRGGQPAAVHMIHHHEGPLPIPGIRGNVQAVFQLFLSLGSRKSPAVFKFSQAMNWSRYIFLRHPRAFLPQIFPQIAKCFTCFDLIMCPKNSNYRVFIVFFYCFTVVPKRPPARSPRCAATPSSKLNLISYVWCAKPPIILNGSFPGGSCPMCQLSGWQLSYVAVVVGSSCPRWQLYGCSCAGGSCPKWQLSGWQLSQMAVVRVTVILWQLS